MSAIRYANAGAIDQSPSSVGSVLDRLDARAHEGALFRDAARVIRRLTEQVSTVEAELIEAELSRFAHAVEIDRMNDHRRAFAERRAAKAGAR
ncbi:hypothetical protein [Bosea sp. FBZP-16]|uniref:hypothetical protein n=1 Tax=Bosea sp. FBZP-16 TaxID=2065382 RepID=UPI000C30E6A4|nr:hypothetical protein [Bosea sp. FBZP-16]